MFMYWDFTCFTATTHFVANYVEFCKKRNFTGSSRFITVLHMGGCQPNLLHGGVCQGPPHCTTQYMNSPLPMKMRNMRRLLYDWFAWDTLNQFMFY